MYGGGCSAEKCKENKREKRRKLDYTGGKERGITVKGQLRGSRPKDSTDCCRVEGEKVIKSFFSFFGGRRIETYLIMNTNHRVLEYGQAQTDRLTEEI